MKRRKFCRNLALGGVALASCGVSDEKKSVVASASTEVEWPLVLSTWNFGKTANAKAWELMSNGGKAIDAVEAAVKVIEADPENTTVGIGGMPDREGIVTLDACIMDHLGNAGSVCALEEIVHPISVARKVMDETPHVILVGEGAQQFAVEQGFKRQSLLTEKSMAAFEEWKKKSKYQPIINIENHDTIGLLAIDHEGNLSGACTTSGLAFKMRGRVGDSPIIGAGLFVDNEVGAATATGLGEGVLKTLGSFLVVELMRQGMSPQEACEEAVMRVVRKQDYKNFQIGYVAINKRGEVGAYSIQPNFTYSYKNQKVDTVEQAKSYVKSK